MQERYIQLYTLPEQSAQGPAVIAEGMLIGDRMTGTVFIQLKLRNAWQKPIKAVTVTLLPMDREGRLLGEAVAFHKADLALSAGKTVIVITRSLFEGLKARAFSAKVTRVVFADGSIWSASEMPKPALPETEVLSRPTAVPAQPAVHPEPVRVQPITQPAAEQPAMVETPSVSAPKRKRKRRKSLLFLVFFCICAVLAAAAAHFVILPELQYRDALALLEEKKYEEAIAAFAAMDGYKDSADLQKQAEEAKAEAERLAALQAAYEEAAAWEQEGAYGKAAIAYAKLDGYQDAREKSFAMWAKVPNRKTISFYIWKEDKNSSLMIHALKQDGTIAVDSWESQWLTDERIASYFTADYRDIVSIHGAVGLKYDGTLDLPGEDFSYYQELSKWTDIVAIAVPGNSWYECYVGLKSDGTVVAAGSNQYGECDVSEWKDIVAIVAGENTTFGLKSDGTVVATGRNKHNKCEMSGQEVSDWSQIKAIAAYDVQTFGLTTSGGVVMVGSNYNGAMWKVRGWSDIVAIDGPYAIKKDGSVLTSLAVYGQYKSRDVSKWEDIIAVAWSDEALAGLKSNGSLIFRYADASRFARAKTWTDIQIPCIPSN